jgi:hypothetical protein
MRDPVRSQRSFAFRPDAAWNGSGRVRICALTSTGSQALRDKA